MSDAAAPSSCSSAPSNAILLLVSVADVDAAVPAMQKDYADFALLQYIIDCPPASGIRSCDQASVGDLATMLSRLVSRNLYENLVDILSRVRGVEGVYDDAHCVFMIFDCYVGATHGLPLVRSQSAPMSAAIRESDDRLIQKVPHQLFSSLSPRARLAASPCCLSS